MKAMRPRTVALVALLSLAAGWLGSSAVSPRAPAAQPTGASRGPRPVGSPETPAPYTEQLRMKLQTQPRSPSPQRNPFVFGDRRAPAPRRVEPGPAPMPVAPPRPVVAGPMFSLSGVASSTVDGQMVRTAIISAPPSLVFAKAGDVLPGGYKVTRVEETFALIMDASGVEQTIRLK